MRDSIVHAPLDPTQRHRNDRVRVRSDRPRPGRTAQIAPRQLKAIYYAELQVEHALDKMIAEAMAPGPKQSFQTYQDKTKYRS